MMSEHVIIIFVNLTLDSEDRSVNLLIFSVNLAEGGLNFIIKSVLFNNIKHSKWAQFSAKFSNVL